ncbi:Protein NrdI [Vibrio stylophorae]|uniref:Protein NrdI n=1 Tax=Vibrio stylophorae TaxID=659351 RepID=A0ABN8DWM0_9VIBR|nr:class Ib ribonucleoside-diphosphate reductase assembly flavoprotein NrdI [Vibrio stylophorae]CAH0535755.1 Protein NrdI [Vibrio stylophorae]
MILYYSSASGNTQRFIDKLTHPAIRIPIDAPLEAQQVNQPFILICPTYADGDGQGAVPKAVIETLNQAQIRRYLVGVIGSGNRNFGQHFARAGQIIAAKCQVPLLYRFELSGTAQDQQRVDHGISAFLQQYGHHHE